MSEEIEIKIMELTQAVQAMKSELSRVLLICGYQLDMQGHEVTFKREQDFRMVIFDTVDISFIKGGDVTTIPATRLRIKSSPGSPQFIIQGARKTDDEICTQFILQPLEEE